MSSTRSDSPDAPRDPRRHVPSAARNYCRPECRNPDYNECADCWKDGGNPALYPRPALDAAIAPEQELASLRKLYGSKFNAITAALGLVSDGILRVEDGDIDRALDQLRKAEGILLDA